MEVSLPISAAVNPSPARTVATGSLLGANAPSIALPLTFTLTGLLALCAGMVWLVLQPSILAGYHYNQYVIAATHLFVLGWICSVVMGAMYQLVPVALETKLYSERLARWQFIFHVVGFMGMVWMFRVWNMKQVGHFGCVLAVGVGLFVYNMARTLWRVPRWNVTATAVSAALAWICLAILSGLSVAAAKCAYDSESASSATGAVGVLLCGLRSIAGFLAHFDPISTMHAHAHLGGVGFFTLLIVGVSYKLIPMFTLSEVQSRGRALCSIALLNLGLAGSFVTILLRSPLKLAFALVIVAALAVYGWEFRRHPARPQTPRAGLGHQILFDSHRAPFAAVRAGRRAVVARFAPEHVHRTTGKPVRLPWIHRRDHAGDHRHALQNHPLSGLVWALQPSNWPRPGSLAGGPLFGPAARAGLLGVSGRTCDNELGHRPVQRNRGPHRLRYPGPWCDDSRAQRGPDAHAFLQTHAQAVHSANINRTKNSMTTNEITEEAILETLRQVMDPELGCNIIDLGLVYSVSVTGQKVKVVMTLTTAGCPMHESIGWGVQQALLNLPGVEEVEVEVVWDPPWHPSMMTEFGREATGAGNF